MRYILAISGGVDSVVLLNLVASSQEFRVEHFGKAIFPDDFIVAHFDHGIRKGDSKKDADFVSNLSKSYNVKFELGLGYLDKDSSEEFARLKRYNFLNNLAIKYKAIIVTAHHKDDLIETAIINLIRGTGWRGLASMSATNILRPLLDVNKIDLIRYAIDNNLNWHDDITNYSHSYLRNRIRQQLEIAPYDKKNQFYKLIQKQLKLRGQIDLENKAISPLASKKCNKDIVLDRYFFTMVDNALALELLNYLTNNLLTYPQLNQVLLFIKLAGVHKKLNYKNLALVTTKLSVRLTFLC